MTKEKLKREEKQGRKEREIMGSDEHLRIDEPQLMDILTCASSLQQREKSGSKIAEELHPYFNISKEGYSLSTLREMAEITGIAQEHLQKVLGMCLPSLEEQEEDLKKMNARPSLDLIIQNYKRDLLRTLSTALPSVTFKTPSYFIDERHRRNLLNNGFSVMRIHYEKQEKIRKSWLKKGVETITLEREKLLATLQFSSRSSDVTLSLYHPLFLKVCGTTLKHLDGRFQRQSNTTYHYFVGEK